MENASKALIIAGAILISILIISFGVIILGQGSEVINNANMSDSEKVTFNSKFEVYEGEKVRGSKVIQMIKAVAAHDRTEQDSNKKVWVVGKNATSLASSLSTIETSFSNLIFIKDTGEDGDTLKGAEAINAGSTYKVKCVYDTNSGLVKAISVIP